MERRKQKDEPFFTDVFGRSFDSVAEVERDLTERLGSLVEAVPAKLVRQSTDAPAPCRLRNSGGAIAIEDVGGSLVTVTRWGALEPSVDGLSFETPGLNPEGFVRLQVEPAPRQLDDWLSLVRSKGRLQEF